MKQLDRWFRLATYLAIVGWLLLVLGPHWASLPTVLSVVVVGLLCAVYVWLLVVVRPADVESPRGSFFTLSGVVRLFSNPRAVLVGWVHILAFDLMVALWVRADAAHHDVGHAWLIPIYALTMMFGPAGLLAYFALRLILGA